MRLQTTFYAWLNLLRKRLRKTHMTSDRKLRLFATLEEQRIRTLHALHSSHLENRFHRQYLSGLLKTKLLLLLWAGRLLRRCWLAWGAHMMRVRIEREVRDELRQLAYTLRVASLSRHAALSRAIVEPDMDERARLRRRRELDEGGSFAFVAAANEATAAVVREQSGGGGGPSKPGPLRFAGEDEEDEFRRHPLDAYILRRAWLGWTCHARAVIETEYAQNALETI